jgi:PKD repeat protein
MDLRGKIFSILVCVLLGISLLNIMTPVAADYQVSEVWAMEYNGPAGKFDAAYALVVDSEDNIYVTGCSQDSDNSVRPITIKYDSQGNELWIKKHTSTNAAGGSDIVIHSSGNIIVATDRCLIGYDPSGYELWVANYPAEWYANYHYFLAMDPSGNIYVTGPGGTGAYDPQGIMLWTTYQGGEGIAADPKTGQIYVTGVGWDFYTICYDQFGNLIWEASHIGLNNDYGKARDIDVDSEGRIYVVGTSINNGTGRDITTVAYNSAGGELWVASFNGYDDFDDKGFDLALDTKGHIYVTGESISGPNGNSDFATIKYDSHGNEVWNATHDGSGNWDDQPHDIVVDMFGNVYVTGWSYGLGGETFGTVSFNSSGGKRWAAEYGSCGNRFDGGWEIGLDSNLNVYVSGIVEYGDTSCNYATVKYTQDLSGFPPVANAGPDQEAYSGYTVNFDGSHSIDFTDPIVDYEWDFGDGSPHENESSTTHSFSHPGTYSVELTVTDSNGLTDEDICIITVVQTPNLLVDAGPDQTAFVNETVYFKGKAYYLNEKWQTYLVDRNGDVGNHNSIVIDCNNNPHISYHDYIPPIPPCGDPLKYAKLMTDGWEIQIVDNEGYVGSHTSIVLDSLDRPHISYFDDDQNALKYARWTGSSWSMETVDPNGGQHTSIALDENNNPHIAYHVEEGNIVNYAKKTGSFWDLKGVDFGSFCSLTLDGNDVPHISYVSEDALKYTTLDESSWNSKIVDSTGIIDYGTSIALDAGGFPHISYFDKTRKCIKYSYWNGDQWSMEIVRNQVWESSDPSIVLDSDGDPHISFSSYGTLNYAEQIPGSWHIESIDSNVQYPGRTVDIALDSHDNPHLSYYDSIERDLKYASVLDSIFYYDWDFGDGSPHSNEKSPTHEYSECGVYTATFTVTDGSGNSAMDSCIITVIDRIPSIYLAEGWNLVSINMIQSITDISSVLESIEGEYDSVQYFDPLDTEDPWKSHLVHKPDSLNDLDDLDHFMGFWIDITTSGGTTLLLNGVELSNNQQIPLHPGWNLVGYPSTVNKDRASALNNIVFGSDVDSIWSFNDTTQNWEEMGPTDYLEMGRGYWIHSKIEKEWDVPYNGFF